MVRVTVIGGEKMKKNKAFILLITIALVLSTVSVGFGDIDYSQWDSNSSYPADLAGTSLLSQARAFIDNGVITGDTDGLFHPERDINRAEYAAVIARATNNTGGIAIAEKKTYFSDLSGYGWAKGYINSCYDAGFINGIGQGKYNPAGSVTYVEVIAIILRSKGITDTTINKYGTWPNNYIKYAELYNMDGALSIRDWTATATKGDVVQLMYRNMPKTSASVANVSITSVPVVAVSTGAVTFTATATGVGTHTYQWYLNNVAIAGATAVTYSTVGNATFGDIYNVKVTTSRSGYSDSVAVSTSITVI